MPIIDFKEIPEAHLATGLQDTFEMFARDFLQEIMGFAIIQGPDRGSDLGKDIIAEETRHGVLGSTRVKWLISCKHKAHSGRSVGVDDEKDIAGRCTLHGATGFIGFYSTIASSRVAETIDLLVSNERINERQIFDRERLEHYLLCNEAGRRLARRYFPASWLEWEDNQPRTFGGQYSPLECAHCGIDLLKSGYGVIAFFNHETEEVAKESTMEETHHESQPAINVEDVRWACQLACDRRTLEKAASEDLYDISRNYSISDFILPENYVETIGSLVKEVCHGTLVFSPRATEKLLHLMSAAAQMTVRHAGYEYPRDMSGPD